MEQDITDVEATIAEAIKEESQESISAERL